MSPGLLMAYLGSWFVCSLLSGISEMSYLGSRNTPTMWNYIFATFVQTSNSGGVTTSSIPIPTDFFNALWNTFSWNFTYLQGDWMILRLAYIVIFSVPVALFLIIQLASIFTGLLKP
jgi:hypothetical protein